MEVSFFCLALNHSFNRTFFCLHSCFVSLKKQRKQKTNALIKKVVSTFFHHLVKFSNTEVAVLTHTAKDGKNLIFCCFNPQNFSENDFLLLQETIADIKISLYGTPLSGKSLPRLSQCKSLKITNQVCVGCDDQQKRFMMFKNWQKCFAILAFWISIWWCLLQGNNFIGAIV